MDMLMSEQAPLSITTENKSEKSQWFVMRAYKNERLAETLLSREDGLPYFIPKQYALRTYHGKKKRELVPVIPGIVFVYASYREIVAFKKLYNPLQYVMWTTAEGKSECLIVPDKQMQDFIKVAGRYQENLTYYMPDEIDAKKGCKVRIHGGVFDGVEGIFVKVKGKRSKRLVVLLEGITAVAVEVQPDLLEFI